MVGTSRICAPLARQSNTVGLDIVEDQLRRIESAGDIDVVIMATQQQILAEIEVLNFAVGGDRGGESGPAARATPAPLPATG
jgi:hypothetical protein